MTTLPSMTEFTGAQVVLPGSQPLSATINFFTQLGFKVRAIVPADDPAAIAAAMQRILAGRDGFRPDAERLARLYGRFGWERQEERLAAVYDGVLERAGRPTQSVGSAARGAAGLVGSKA